MKNLIVTYLPNAENSNTKKLLDYAKLKISGDVEELNLVENNPPFHDHDSLDSYYKRNYLGHDLSTEEALAISSQDKLKDQLVSADNLIMAYPMHNFGMPGAIKAYLDAVIMNKETFEMGKKLMAGKKSLTIFTSGGEYDHDHVDLEFPHWDTLTLLAKINFNFMGYDQSEVVCASTNDENEKEKSLLSAKSELDTILNDWYGD